MPGKAPKNKPVESRDWLTVAEVAELAEVSTAMVRTWIHRGAVVWDQDHQRAYLRLPAMFVKGFRILKTDFAEFLQAITSPGSVTPIGRSRSPAATPGQRRRADGERGDRNPGLSLTGPRLCEAPRPSEQFAG